MASNINFIQIDPDEACYYCGNRKIKENDKFYRVLVGDKPMNVVVCELCKGGFSGQIFEGAKKSYTTHFAFYVKRSLLEQKEKLSRETLDDLLCSIENYESGNYATSFRNIGLVAERLTNKLYDEKFDKSSEMDRITWENKLDKLLDIARKAGDITGESAIHQLFSLKILGNSADHPSNYNITAEDARLGLASLSYLLQWKMSGSCRIL